MTEKSKEHVIFENKIRLINPNIDVLVFDKDNIKSKMFCNKHNIEFSINKGHALYHFYTCPLCKTQNMKGEQKDILKKQILNRNFVGEKTELKMKEINDCQSYKTFCEKFKAINPNVIIIKFLNNDEVISLYCLSHQIEFDLYKKQIYKNYSCPICKTQRLKNTE